MLKVKRNNGDILNTINHIYNIDNHATPDLFNSFGIKKNTRDKAYVSPA
jgi:hypothetical protein